MALSIKNEEKMVIEKVKISTLINDPNNARKHDAKNIMAIKGSLAKFGQQKPIVVNDKNIVIAGNGTLQAASEMGWSDIDVVRSTLDGFNATAYALADNRTSELAAWDVDNLNQQLAQLDIGGFDIKGIGFDDGDFKGEDNDDESEKYSAKMEAPIYEPKGEKPPECDLCNIDKMLTLVAEIESKDIPQEEKAFLTFAAYRHIVFNYENIAEYYCHASKEVQELMEKSALVIIDYNKAIENGFVNLVGDLAKAYKNDQK